MAHDAKSILFTSTPITITQCLNSARDRYERTKLATDRNIPPEFKQTINPIFSGSPLEVASHLNVISSTLYSYDFVNYRLKDSTKISAHSTDVSNCGASIVYGCFCKSVDSRLPSFESFGSTEEVALNACCAQMLYVLSPKPHLAALLLERFKRSLHSNSSFTLFSKPIPSKSREQVHNLESKDNNCVNIDCDQVLIKSASECGVDETKNSNNDQLLCETADNDTTNCAPNTFCQKSESVASEEASTSLDKTVLGSQETYKAGFDCNANIPNFSSSHEGTFSALKALSNKYALNTAGTQSLRDDSGYYSATHRRSPFTKMTQKLVSSEKAVVMHSDVDTDRTFRNGGNNKGHCKSPNHGKYSIVCEREKLKTPRSPKTSEKLSRNERRKLAMQDKEPTMQAEDDKETLTREDLDQLRYLITENTPLKATLKRKFASVLTKANVYTCPTMQEFRLEDAITVEQFLCSKKLSCDRPVNIAQERWDRLKNLPNIVPSQAVQVLSLKRKCGKFISLDYGMSRTALLAHNRLQLKTRKKATTVFEASASTSELAVQACYAQALRHFLKDTELAVRLLNNFIKRNQDSVPLVLFEDPVEIPDPDMVRTEDIDLVETTEELRRKLEDLNHEKQILSNAIRVESDVEQFVENHLLNWNDEKMKELMRHPRVDSVEIKCNYATDKNEKFEVTLDINDRYLVSKKSDLSFIRACESALFNALYLMEKIKDRGEESLIPSDMVDDHRLLVSLVELKTGQSIVDQIPITYKYDCDFHYWKAKMIMEGVSYYSKSNTCQSQKEALNDLVLEFLCTEHNCIVVDLSSG